MTEKNTADFTLSGDLRLGVIWDWYYNYVLGTKMPKQIDALDEFFPKLFVEEVASCGEKKQNAEFDDRNFLIRAARYHGHYYIGGSRRVTQILGRLVGTAKGSRTKERSTAERLQIWAADILISSPEALKYMRDTTEDKILGMTEEQLKRFTAVVPAYIEAVAARRSSQSFDDQQSELFPIGDEVLEIMITNTAYQWDLGTCDGIVNAFQWILLGALLRSQLPRLDRKYLSTFEPRVPDEFPVTDDDLQEGDLCYSGDDLDRRFPGIDFICDRCGERLNEQPGFDDHQRFWVCRKCGYKNKIDIDSIYSNEKAYQSGADPIDKDEFCRALKERTDETGNTDYRSESASRKVR